MRGRRWPLPAGFSILSFEEEGLADMVSKGEERVKLRWSFIAGFDERCYPIVDTKSGLEDQE